MPYWFFTTLSLTIYLPAVMGLLRARRVEAAFYPFLILVWVGAVSETAGQVLIDRYGTNLFLYNVYSLGEWWLLLWQFSRWGLFNSVRPWYLVLAFAGGALWAAEGLILNSLQRLNAYFLIAASFGAVVMAILTISKTAFFETYRLWQNPKFLICLGIILFFTFSILIEVFLLFGRSGSTAFRNGIYELLYYSNALVNVLFAYSVLCIPTRLRFIGPSPS